MKKSATLLLVAVLTASSLLMFYVAPASAELPKPSVPEFTLNIINYSVIEVTIKNQPEHVLALTVQMVVHAEEGRLSQAKQIAQKVITLDKNEQSPSHRTAAQILATNEQQDSEKEPMK